MAMLLALVVGGCDFAGRPVDEQVARDIDSFRADGVVVHEIKRVVLGSNTYALLTGTAPEGRQRIGLFGYQPDGTGFITAWDQAEPGERISFEQDREGIGDGGPSTVWTARAYGVISDPRAVQVLVTTADGVVTEVDVEAPGYVLEVPATEEGGIVQAVFVDAAGAVVASFPTDD
jgi:hypothetical protein